MKILSLTAEHVKRLRVVSIRPDGAAIVLAGENEQGKSSVLDAIEMALVGKRATPPVPIHQGEKRARVVLDMGEYKVTRTFTPGGNGTLTVEAPNGTLFKSPQAVLDKLIGDFTFDPMAFVHMEPKDQTATLRRLAGIDTEVIDQAIKDARDERRSILEDLKLQEAALDQAPAFPEAGTTLRSPEEIAAVLQNAHAIEQETAAREGVANRAMDAFERAKAEVERAVARVAAARQALAEAEELERTARIQGNQAFKDQQAAARAYQEHLQSAPNVAEMRELIVNATEHNRRVQANLHHANIRRRLDEQQARADELAALMTEQTQVRAALLAGAKFPITGLGITEDGTITWNGLPFEQASEAVRVRVSVSIGLALNPALKVLLIRNGNDLGHKNLHAIAEMAEQAGAQVWIERIAGGDGLQTVVIEDGAVIEQIAQLHQIESAIESVTTGDIRKAADAVIAAGARADMAEAMPTLAAEVLATPVYPTAVHAENRRLTDAEFAPLAAVADGLLKGGPPAIREAVNRKIREMRDAPAPAVETPKPSPPTNAGEFE